MSLCFWLLYTKIQPFISPWNFSLLMILFFKYQLGWVILYSIVLHALCLWSLSPLSWPADGQQGDHFCRILCQTTATSFFCFLLFCVFSKLLINLHVWHHARHNVCCQRSRGTRAVWAADVTATWTSQPASASVNLASLDASARVPFNRAFLIAEYTIAPGISSLNQPLIVSSSLNERDWLYWDSVQQFDAELSVSMAALERSNALACVMLAMLELSAQVRLASFCSRMCG